MSTTTTSEPTRTRTCARCAKPAETIFHATCASRPAVFRDLGLAWSYANRSPRPLIVVQGDPGQFWVVTHRAAGWLLRAGYEIAAHA